MVEWSLLNQSFLMYQVNTIVEKLGKSATYQQLVMKFGQSIAEKNCPSCYTVYRGVIGDNMVGGEQISGG